MNKPLKRIGIGLLIWGGIVAAASSFYPSYALERDVKQHLMTNGIPEEAIIEIDCDRTHLRGDRRLLVDVKVRGDSTVYTYYRERSSGQIRLASTLTDRHETLVR